MIKHFKDKRLRFLSLIRTFFFFLVLIPTSVIAEEYYAFERMWPTLPQPWYFYRPLGAAVDAEGYVYVVERDGNRVVKLDFNGTVLSE